MKKLLLALALLVSLASPAYAEKATTASHPAHPITRPYLLELFNEASSGQFTFVQDGHRVTALAARTPHPNERWISIDGQTPQLVVDTGNMVAEGATGTGSFLGFANAYAACTDLGGGLCLTTAGALQIADPVVALVVTTLTPTNIAGAVATSGAWTHVSATPDTYNNGGTSCAGATLCTASMAYSSSGAVTWTVNAPAGSSRFVIVAPNSGSDSCTTSTSGSILELQKVAGTDMDKFNCGGDYINLSGNILANSAANGSGEVLTGNSTAIGGAVGTGDILIGGNTTTSQTNGTCAVGSGCGAHLHQGVYFNDNGQNAATQTCTAPFICEYTGSVTTTPTAYTLTFLQSFTKKPFCQFYDYTHPADLPTAVTFTGASPFTAVTFTVTTSLADDSIISCTVGNGP